jgi:nitrous oxide reductase
MTRRTIRGLMAAAVMAAAPFTVKDGAVAGSTAECQSGTCCSESGSTCVIGWTQKWDHYYKSSGSCSGSTSPGDIDYKDIPW